MPRSRILVTLLLLLAPLTLHPLHGQATPPIDHAKRVFELLRQDKFDEVATEFNAQMAAAITAAQLKEGWVSLQQQVGAFQSFIEERAATAGPGIHGVLLGCQFEKAAVNFSVTFDADNKIGGMRLSPRP